MSDALCDIPVLAKPLTWPGLLHAWFSINLVCVPTLLINKLPKTLMPWPMAFCPRAVQCACPAACLHVFCCVFTSCLISSDNGTPSAMLPEIHVCLQFAHIVFSRCLASLVNSSWIVWIPVRLSVCAVTVISRFAGLALLETGHPWLHLPLPLLSNQVSFACSLAFAFLCWTRSLAKVRSSRFAQSVLLTASPYVLLGFCSLWPDWLHLLSLSGPVSVVIGEGFAHLAGWSDWCLLLRRISGRLIRHQGWLACSLAVVAVGWGDKTPLLPQSWSSVGLCWTSCPFASCWPQTPRWFV